MFKRMTAVYILIIIAFSALMLRLRFLSEDRSALSAAAQTQSRLTLTSGQCRGQIYDRYFRRMVNDSEKQVCAVNPTSKAVKALLNSVPDKEQFLERANSGKPFLLQYDGEIENDDIIRLKYFERYSENQLAPHIIGYINSDGHGVSGIEAAFDEHLQNDEPQAKITYEVNALGRALNGTKPEVKYSQDSAKGVWLTLDKNIQKIAEDAAARYIEKGAVVIMQTNTGNVLACVSTPDFSPLDISSALNSSDSPMLNRAFCSYNLGSLFKLVTSSAALESGITEKYQYHCEGTINISGQVFACNNRSGHGTVNMSEALKSSCNPYFINLGQCIGGQTIYDMAVKMGFGSAICFADGVASSKGSLPQRSQLMEAVTANFSFGQGELLATPVQVCGMINTIASDGEYYAPMLVNGAVDDEKNAADKKSSEGVRVMSIETAHSLQTMMRGVLSEDGTGSTAYCKKVTAAGKTATAETGIMKNGEMIEHSWFGGFFPYLSPKYSVVVFCEGNSNGRQTTQPAFKYIAERITEEIGLE